MMVNHSLSAYISVSHTHRENLCIRWGINPSKIHIIPNAVDSSIYCPLKSKPKETIKIILMSRLAYRKVPDIFLIGN